MNYLHWDQKTITDFSDSSVSEMYEKGYVFTRLGKGVMQQTRSVRIDTSKFELSSENRRILKKTGTINLFRTPLPAKEYVIGVGKMAKDFYDTKFGLGIMSAQKVKEMLMDADKSNFDRLLSFETSTSGSETSSISDTFPTDAIGYAICFANDSLLHYSYPFYDLGRAPKDMGLGMMTRTIDCAKKQGKKYVYLGSLQRPGDTYKLQFSGLEWFDGKVWQTDLAAAKKILS